MSARATDVVFSLYNLSSLAVDFHTNRSRYPVEYRSQTGRESKTLRSFISFRDLSRRKQRCVLRRSSSRCALCHRELVNGYKREAFQWIHYVGQPIRRRRASVAVETGPDGTDCVDELVNKFVIHKNGKEFPLRISGVQTNSREALRGKEGGVQVYLVRGQYTSCSGYTLELR